MISPLRRLLGLAVALAFLTSAMPPASAQTAEDAELHRRMEEAYQAGQYEQALPFAQQLLRSAEQQLSPDDPRLAGVIFEVANVCRLAARADESLALFRRALAIRERAFGLDAPQVGQVLIAIGVTSADDGRYAEAEQVYKRAIAIAEKAGNHFNIAATLHDLSMTYYAEGRMPTRSRSQNGRLPRCRGRGNLMTRMLPRNSIVWACFIMPWALMRKPSRC
jgi:tetratricopeptide (TPR) repeat protein